MIAKPSALSFLTIDHDIAAVLQRDLKKLGLYNGPVSGGSFDDATRKALRDFINTNNFENKMRKDERTWKSILDYIGGLTQKT